MKKKLQVIVFALLLCSLGWNAITYRELLATREVVDRNRERALMNSNAINDGQGVKIQLFQLEKRVENTENWIWNFEDIMFGPAEETPAATE